MAGDWIKMRVGLRRDPKVLAIARHLAGSTKFQNYCGDPIQRCVTECVTEIVTFPIVTRVTVASLLELWGALNESVNDENEVPCMALSDIDDIADLPGLGEALEWVGWVEVIDPDDERKGLRFNNFREHNTPAKDRKQAKTDAERAREYRQRKKAQEQESASVTNVTKRHAREEKRREEIKEPPIAPLGGVTASDDKSRSRSKSIAQDPDGFAEFWDAWPRRDGRKAAVAAWRKLKPDEPTRQAILADIERSKSVPAWRGSEINFCPLPATYLNGQRWRDEWATPKRTAARKPSEDELRRFGYPGESREDAIARWHQTPEHSASPIDVSGLFQRVN